MTQWLLASVDTLSDFASRTKSSGRLQAYRAYQVMHDWCSQHDAIYRTNELLKSSALTIWPNPSYGTVHLNWAGDAQLMVVYGPLGQLLYSGKPIHELNDRNWSSGMYVIRIQYSDGRSASEQLLVNP